MRFFYNFKTMNPEKKHMNVLDYGLASIMMPTTLAGSQIGGFVLLIFPSLYIQIMLTLLLTFLTYTAYSKALQIHRKEVAEEDNLPKQVAEEDEFADPNDLLRNSMVNTDTAPLV